MLAPIARVLTVIACLWVAAASGAGAVTTLDANGDARPDLAVADHGSGTVSVLLNTTAPDAATASYAAARSFHVGELPVAIVATDVNGDGLPDLAVAHEGRRDVSVLLNTTAPGDATASFVLAGSFAAGSVPGLVENVEGAGPDPFSFVDQTDVERDRQITSAPVTITGISDEAPITVTGGKYSIGCAGKYTSSSGTLRDGDRVCVRHTSADADSTATHTTLRVAGVSDTFTSTTAAPDLQPDAFAFTDVRNAQLNTTQTSNAVTIRGLTGAAPISVSGGEYSIGCGSTFTAAAGTIANNQTVCVRHTSAGGLDIATDTTLTVGGVADTFTSTTPSLKPLEAAGALGPGEVLLGLLLVLGMGRRRAYRGG